MRLQLDFHIEDAEALFCPLCGNSRAFTIPSEDTDGHWIQCGDDGSECGECGLGIAIKATDDA